MSHTTNWPFLIITLGIFLIMVLSIGFLLHSLVKKGDERKNLIQRRAMSGTLAVVIVILIVHIIISLILNHQLRGLNPLLSLTIISITFFVLLMINKKKYGG